jgi:hypothetical protein
MFYNTFGLLMFGEYATDFRDNNPALSSKFFKGLGLKPRGF